MAKRLFRYSEPINGYVEDKDLLRYELDKLLKEPHRRDNIRKATEYIDLHIKSTPRAKAKKKK
jgi:hypothetical protein